MKVYVVMIGYYAEGYTVEAVCGSPMLANQIKDKLQEDEEMESGGGEVVVKEYPVLTNIQQFNLGGPDAPQSAGPAVKVAHKRRNFKISSMLDRIADHLQHRGLMKEASEIDIIANTMDLQGYH